MMLAGVAVFLVGLVLLAVGVRGRRIDGHPVCAGCRFDLVGLGLGGGRAGDQAEHPAGERPRRCPECGAELASPRSIRIGNRRRRRGAIVLGLGLALTGLGLGGGTAWSRAATFDWNTVKPLWWLRIEAESANPVRAELAGREVLLRVVGDRLKAAVARPFIEIALRNRMAGPSGFGTWPDLINIGRRQGVVTDEEWEAYIVQGVRVGPGRHTARVREGGLLKVRLPLEYGPFGSFGSFGKAPSLRISLQRLEAVIGGATVEPVGELMYVTHTDGSSSGGGWGWPAEASLNMPKGTYPTTIRAVVEIREENGQPAAAPIIRSYEWPGQLSVVGRGDEVVELVRDQALRAQVEGSVSVDPGRAGIFRGVTHVKILVYGNGRSSPVQAVMRVHARVDGVDYWLGRTVAWGPEGSHGESGRASDVFPPHLPDRVDVVLKPDVAEAEVAGCDRIWGDEIVIPDVALEWFGQITDMQEFTRPR